MTCDQSAYTDETTLLDLALEFACGSGWREVISF